MSNKAYYDSQMKKFLEYCADEERRRVERLNLFMLQTELVFAPNLATQNLLSAEHK